MNLERIIMIWGGNHSVRVANAAKIIAENIKELEPERAYILGLFHDIGRSLTKADLQHVTEGYNFMMELGYSDCPAEDYEHLKRYLEDCKYDDYDKLIQLWQNGKQFLI